MAKKSFREQEYLRRAKEILEEQSKSTPVTTGEMTPQQKTSAAKNTAYENVLKAFIAQSNLQASDPVKNRAGDVLAYALQDPAQRNATANVLLSGEGTKLNKGDIKNWDAGTARNAIIENELFMELMRDAGMYDAPEYATSNQYITLASTNYLKQLLEEQNREWEAVRQKNAQADEWKNKYENDKDFRATWQYWNELYNMQYKMTEDNAPFFWAYADYLQGDRSQPFDAEALEQLWMEMPDEEFYPEMERLQKQYEAIDLKGIATANSPERADDSGFVQSTTNIENELERREQLDYLSNLASEIVAYEKENRGVDPTVYTSPFDYAYEDINHGTVEGSRQLAAMMNDIGYYINNVEQLSYGQHGEIGTGNYWNLDFELSGYNFLTETEKKRYNALSSIGLGDAYLRALEADLLRRRAMWQENRDTVYAENPVTGVAGSVGTVVTQPLTSTMTLMAGMAGENNPNAPAYDMQRWQNTTRGVRGEIWGDMMSFDVLGQPVGTTVYNTLMSMADMGYAMLWSGGLAGGNEAFAKAGMQFIMSSEAAASTLHADLERGFSAEQALLHGIANGAVEAITEKLPIDTLFTKDGKFLWRVLKSGLSEGGEEVASGVLQLGTDALASYMAGKESEVEATYKEFAKTMSHEEAALATLKHYAQDIALQGLSGFGSGGMLGTATHATNDARVRGAGKNVQTQGDIDALITIAEGMGEGTQSRQWAERLKGKKKGNGRYSNYDVGRLTMALEQEVSAELAEAPNQVMDEAIEGRLLELGETPENAKALAPVVRQTYRGQPIKRSVARAVNWNDHADQVVKELSRETTEQDAGRTGVDWANRAKDSQAATEQAAEKARRVKEAALGKGVPKTKMAPEAEGSVKKSAGKAAQKGEQLAELGKAVIKGDGKQSTAISYTTEEGSKQGEVVRFAEADGSMQLVVEEETEGGKTERTVAPEDIGAAATKGLGAVIAYVTDESEQQRRMSEQEANTMLQVYNETGGDAQDFIEGYEAAYLAGYAGIEVPAVNIDSKAAELAYKYGAQNAQADEANRATRAGRRGAQGTGTVTWLGTVSSNAEVTGKGGDISAAMETMTESQRTTAEVVQALAKQMSIDVTLFESSADTMEGIQNGSFIPGTNRIYIDVNSGAANVQSLTEQKANGTLGYAMVKTMAHELTHYMESNSAEGYAAYKQAVKNALKESGQDWATLVRGKLDAAILAGNKLSLAGAEAEVIADASEYMLQNSAFVQGLDNSLRGKVKQFIQNFMEKVRSIFANLTGGHRESAALRQTIDGVMQYTGNLQRLWDAGIREATGRNYAENATMRTGTTVQAATDQNTSQTEEAVEEIYEEPAKAVAEERTVQEVIEEPTARELKQEVKATQKIAPQELIQGIADRFGIDIRVVDRANLLASYNPDNGVILIGKNASTGEVLYKALGMELMRHAQKSQYAKQLQSAVSLAAYAGNPDGYFADLRTVADEMNRRFDNYGKRKLTAESPIVQAEVFARMAAKVFGNESSMMTLIEQNFQKPTLLQRIRNALKSFVRKLRGLKTPAMTPVQRAEYLLGQALKDAQKAAANPAKGAQLLENFTDTHVDAANRQTMVAYTTMMEEEAELEVDGDRGEVRYSIRDSQGKELVMNQQDLENNKKTISGMASVSTASGNRFVNLDGANYRRAVQGFFDNEGKTFTNPTVGDVRITTSGMKHLTRYKSTLKSALVPCVKAVIENGLVVDIDDNHAMRGEPTVVLAAPVTLDNKGYYMGVAVRQANNLDKLYHIHEAALIEQEKGDHPATKTEPLQAEPSPDGHPSIYSILDSIRKYNRESVDLSENDVQYSTRGQTETEEFKRWFGDSVVVNEDGTPKVMYHGTATEFWSFDKRKANDATGRKLGLGAGKGKFYLSEYEGVGKAAADSARSMGKGKNPKVMELYVSAQKVMDRQEYDKRLNTAYGKYPNSNPKSVEYDYRARDKAIAEVDRQIRKEGYDGVWDRDSGEMFVYEPTQIKSATDNVGTFDPENADIRYSTRDAAAETTVREYLADADDSMAVTVEERNALQIYQDRLQAHAKATQAVLDAENAMKGKDGEALKDARAALARARAAQREQYNLLLKLEGTDHVQSVMQRTQQFITEEITGKTREDIAGMISEREQRIQQLEKDLRGLQGAARAQREADIREQKRIVRALKNKATYKLEKRTEEFRAREQKAREYRRTRDEVNKLRRSIGRSVKRLNGLRVRETDQKHVPQELQHVADMVMQTFTDSSLARLAFSQKKAASLSSAYAKLLQQDTDEVHYWDEEIEQDIKELAEQSKAYNALANKQDSAPSYFSLEGVKMEREILTSVQNIVDHVLKLIDDTNKAFMDGRQETFKEYATKTVEALEKKKDHKRIAFGVGKKLETLSGAVNYGNKTPIYFFRELGIPQLEELGQKLFDAEHEYGIRYAEADAKLRHILEKYNYWAWDRNKTVTFKTKQAITQEMLENGKGENAAKHVVTMDLGTAMAVYATWKREHHPDSLVQTRHLDKGGFVKKGVIKEGVFEKKDETPHLLAEADYAYIDDMLTKDQKAFVDEMVQFMTEYGDIYGNRTSMKMFGYKKFNDKYYFPISTQRNQLKKNSDAATRPSEDGRLKNMKSSKKRISQASTPVEIGDFLETVQDHIQQMILYSTFAEPIEDLNRVMNYAYEDATGSRKTVRGLIEQKYGKNAVDYIDKLTADLNGGVKTDKAETFFAKMFSMFKKSRVVASLSVALQQPTSIIRAMMEVNPKYFVPLTGKANVNLLQEYEQLEKHSGVAVLKKMGGFDMTNTYSMARNLGGTEMDGYSIFKKMRTAFMAGGQKGIQEKTQAASEQWNKAFGWLASKMDMIAWIGMWRAIKNETHAKYPSLDVNSEGFLDIAGKRFNEVMRLTQVYDSTMARSQNMRSNTMGMKMITSFAAEPTLTANMLQGALKSKNGKKIARAIAVYYASQIITAAAAAIIKAGRDDDESKTYAEKFLASMGNALGGYSGGLNPLAQIPGVRDLLSLLDGYDLERGDMSIFADITDELKKLEAGKYDDDPQKGLEKAGGAIANLFGIPLENIMRDVRSIWNSVRGLANPPRATNPGVLLNDAKENFALRLIFEPETSVKSYYAKLFEALAEDDMEEVDDLTAYLGAIGKEADAIIAGVRDAYKARYEEGGIAQDEAVQFLLDNDLVKGDTPEKRRMKAFEYVDKWNEGEAGGGVYVSIKAALRRGDMATVDREIEELISYGWTADAVYSEMNSEAKKAYIEGKISKDAYKNFYEKHGIAAGKEAKDDNGWYWTFRELDYAKGNGGSTEGYDMHADLWTAVDSGANLRATINEYQSHGRTREDLNRAMNDHYQQILVDLYQTNRAEFTRVQARVLTAYAQLGYDREQKRKTIENWVK